MRKILVLSRSQAFATAGENGASADQFDRLGDYYHRLFALVPPIDCDKLAAP